MNITNLFINLRTMGQGLRFKTDSKNSIIQLFVFLSASFFFRDLLLKDISFASTYYCRVPRQ